MPLDPAAVVEIDKFLENKMQKWATWFGIANLAVVASSLFYIYFVLPDKAYSAAEVKFEARYGALFSQQLKAINDAAATAIVAQRDAQSASSLISATKTIVDTLGPNPPLQELTKLIALAKAPDQAKSLVDMIGRLSAVEKANPLDKVEIFLHEQPVKSGEGNYQTQCPPGSRVISGFCSIKGPPNGPNVNIQNFGISQNGWHCLWRDRADNVTVAAFCARAK